MNPTDIRNVVLRHLGAIAPEADLDQLDPKVSLREQLDIDSVDFLNLVIAVHKELHVEIPEKDYPKLVTLQGCVDYLTTACQAGQPAR